MKKATSYYNELIDFYIEKPEGWSFFPTQWARTQKTKTAASNSNLSAIMAQSKTPLLYMQRNIGRDNLAQPTVQASCRYFAQPSRETRANLAALQIQVFEENYANFKLLSHCANSTLSNCPALFFHVQFSLKHSSGEAYECLSQSWTVFSNDISYTIGLSGSPENINEYESDLSDIISSVAIGQSS
jgi:hypothetical protein